MKIYKIAYAVALALLASFAVFPSASLRAQTDADIYNNAFEVVVPINVNNFTYTSIAIPEGKRLVIQNVSMSGEAQTNGPYIQPIVILAATLGSNPQVVRYFGPNQSGTNPGQFYQDFETTMYADSLDVGPAFAGYTPTSMGFNVVITGYLVSMPPSPPSLKVIH